jgi:hypothetical protein
VLFYCFVDYRTRVPAGILFLFPPIAKTRTKWGFSYTSS